VLSIVGTTQPVARALSVNPSGIVVGYDLDPRNDVDPLDAWVRQFDGALEYLPELSAGNSAAYGINRFGTIAGYSQNSSGRYRAVIWRVQ
jgi:hypothetical protein